jgi:ubiquitin fusion degradation protein 1
MAKQVDFAAPKGYVEPARPQPAAAPTMADKLKIDLHNYSPGSSRPPSATGANAGTDGGAEFESFKGAGQTLGGRKTKGKGLKNSTKKIEEVDPASRIIRTE